MERNKKIEIRIVTFKSLLVQMILFSLGINLVSSFFSPYEFDLLLTISPVIGIVIAMPIIYYFLNNKNFKPMLLPKVSLVVLLSIPFIGIVALAVYFGIEYVC
ncbi:hypothetical protein [Carnobacterium inhibens]|uniref:hypothetical protein n=1 Tax=Carnobacterium inhibens TaxID=147709 RepID=UPI0005539E27|nr:hypothetical protein [Carnobacterium inhibens]